MHTIPATSYQFPQRLHPLSLLAPLISRQMTGLLQVTSGAVTWQIYLEQGKLIFASNSANPFERLDRYLRRLSAQVPTLVSAVRVQVRLLFESNQDEQSLISPDYRAICWLVEQHYLNSNQVKVLIEALVKDVLESFLTLKEGTHQFVNADQLEELNSLCHLDLRSLVEQCQNQVRRRQTSNTTATALNNQPKTRPTDLNSRLVSNYVRPKEQPPSPPQAPVASSKNTYTIACIDDSPTVLHAIKSFLDDKSFSVLMISNPVQALMQIMRHKPDLILLDVEMPNLDGYELCSLLRRHAMFRHTPIIMVTGNTGIVDRAKAKLVRASGYLTKPFTQSDLLKMVFKHLT